MKILVQLAVSATTLFGFSFANISTPVLPWQSNLNGPSNIVHIQEQPPIPGINTGDLQQFIESVKRPNTFDITGLYVNEGFKMKVDNVPIVGPLPRPTDTIFKYQGITGINIHLAAHEDIIGEKLESVTPGQTIVIIYGTGNIRKFKAEKVLHFIGDKGDIYYKGFIDTQTGEKISPATYIRRLQAKLNYLSIQTCDEFPKEGGYIEGGLMVLVADEIYDDSAPRTFTNGIQLNVQPTVSPLDDGSGELVVKDLLPDQKPVALCRDGWTSYAKPEERASACSNHQGVAKWYDEDQSPAAQPIDQPTPPAAQEKTSDRQTTDTTPKIVSDLNSAISEPEMEPVVNEKLWFPEGSVINSTVSLVDINHSESYLPSFQWIGVSGAEQYLIWIVDEFDRTILFDEKWIVESCNNGYCSYEFEKRIKFPAGTYQYAILSLPADQADQSAGFFSKFEVFENHQEPQEIDAVDSVSFLEWKKKSDSARYVLLAADSNGIKRIVVVDPLIYCRTDICAFPNIDLDIKEIGFSKVICFEWGSGIESITPVMN